MTRLTPSGEPCSRIWPWTLTIIPLSVIPVWSILMLFPPTLSSIDCMASVELAPRLSLVVWFVVGAANTARVQGTWTYVQGRFEPGVLARVTMNVYLFTGVASAIGAIVIGSLSTVWDPAMLTDLVSFGFIGSAVLGLALPETRALAF